MTLVVFMCEHSVTMSSQMAICCLATLVGNDLRKINDFKVYFRNPYLKKRV